MVGHFISEHVENAGVHSGDATLILPPQDLEATTIQRIEEATRKIGEALNVTGPYNIQFIAKDNDIKVIECNVRASRSFPFVSKVMGVDLIEMATKAIMGVPFVAYPPTQLPENCVGVKVPQFSFSRLSGADPVLGVEMASTGEVACFGRNKYEAYIKALISTGFKLPNKNILFSIGSYKDKKEMLPSVQTLQKLGYKLFATAGTADFLQEHDVPVQYLEILGKDEDDQKSEYSLTQHLANNMIDLYINLPSSNRYRRPASYMSKGYQTRRMAVDYQTPLVTNVKNAKILIEAIARQFDFEISDIDAQTGTKEVVLPDNVSEISNYSTLDVASRSRFLDGASSQAPPRTASQEIGTLYPQPSISASLRQLLGQSPFKDQHVLSVNQFKRQDLHLLFTVAQEMRLGVQKEGILDVLKGKLLCTMFFEPSTRTSASFDAAMQRLGGRTVSIATAHSSTQKGESLADTIRTLGCYGDAIVLRHPDESSADTAAKFSPVPIINGGNGSKEHPTQAFLDLFTIREELGTVTGLTITFVGDLRFGRTVHSLVKLLQHYDVSIQLVSPAELSLPSEILDIIKSKPGQLRIVSTELTPEIVAQSDVLYCTRVQKERFSNLSEYERLKDSFIVSNETLTNAKAHMIVMHPLPRNHEIAEEVDFDQRAAYFRQVSPTHCVVVIFTNISADEIWSILPNGFVGFGHGSVIVKMIVSS
jgi:carbamoyl-phosphate synthase/aspartate carbamoyltransferase